MFGKGRQEQPIKYKAEVLKSYPSARWSFNGYLKYGAIMCEDKRISEAYRIAWKAWEDAYYRIQNTKSIK